MQALSDQVVQSLQAKMWGFYYSVACTHICSLCGKYLSPVEKLNLHIVLDKIVLKHFTNISLPIRKQPLHSIPHNFMDLLLMYFSSEG